jgi:hypothetical protein
MGASSRVRVQGGGTSITQQNHESTNRHPYYIFNLLSSCFFSFFLLTVFKLSSFSPSLFTFLLFEFWAHYNNIFPIPPSGIIARFKTHFPNHSFPSDFGHQVPASQTTCTHFSFGPSELCRINMSNPSALTSITLETRVIKIWHILTNIFSLEDLILQQT